MSLVECADIQYTIMFIDSTELLQLCSPSVGLEYSFIGPGCFFYCGGKINCDISQKPPMCSATTFLSAWLLQIEQRILMRTSPLKFQTVWGAVESPSTSYIYSQIWKIFMVWCGTRSITVLLILICFAFLCPCSRRVSKASDSSNNPSAGLDPLLPVSDVSLI